MYSRKVELIVGGFILLGIFSLAFLSLQVSGLMLNSARGDTYNLSANFNNVSGLTPRARVTIAGVNVGYVTGIKLDPVTVRAKVDFAINKDVDYITTDSIAAIKTAGVLGEQYVDISVGGASDVLSDGGVIYDTQSALVLEDLVGKIMTSMASSKE